MSDKYNDRLKNLLVAIFCAFGGLSIVALFGASGGPVSQRNVAQALPNITVDVNAGTIDGTVIGGTTAAAATFTSATISGSVLQFGTCEVVAGTTGTTVYSATLLPTSKIWATANDETAGGYVVRAVPATGSFTVVVSEDPMSNQTISYLIHE